MKKVAVVASHPIQYQAPMFRALATLVDLRVYFAHRQGAAQQAAAGYGVPFEWDVDLLAGYASSFLTNVSSRPGVDAFRAADTPGVLAAIREFQPAAVVAMGWNLKCYWQAADAARRVGSLALVRGDSQLATPRSRALRAAKRLLYPRMLRRFDRFLPVGRRSREYLEHYGVPANRCFVCPHTIDLERFFAASNLPDTERVAARAQFGAAPGDLVLAFVGRFLAWKRPGQILEAVARLPNRTGILCLFVGGGDEEEALRRDAARAGVRAAFHGFVNQSEMPRVLALADALVVASTGRETWGLVANEALASGTAVIVSDEAGCAPDLSELGSVCRSYRGGDVDALATALATHLAPRTGETAARCREAARSFAPEVPARAVVDAMSAEAGSP